MKTHIYNVRCRKEVTPKVSKDRKICVCVYENVIDKGLLCNILLNTMFSLQIRHFGPFENQSEIKCKFNIFWFRNDFSDAF